MNNTEPFQNLEQDQRASRLRPVTTPGEAVLWEHLQAERGHGLTFQRQALIGPFIFDFYCPAHRLIVEVNGEHASAAGGQQEAGADLFEGDGYRFLHFRSEEVENNPQAAISTILNICQSNHLH